MERRVGKSKRMIYIFGLLGIFSLFYIFCLITAYEVFAGNEIRELIVPLLWIKPVSQAVFSGEYKDITFRLDNNQLSNISGVGIIAEYDSSLLSVVDASGNPIKSIIPGSCPAPDYIVEDTAGEGKISYGVVSLTPCISGDVAKAYFRCSDNITTQIYSMITISESVIADPDANSIQHSTQNAKFVCNPKFQIYIPYAVK